MKLFTELVEDVQFIVEEKNGKKNLFITCKQNNKTAMAASTN